MQFLLGLVAGLIIGWIIEWIIDWQFWRVDPEKATGSPGNERLQADLAQARAQIAALEAQLQTTPDVPVTDHMNAAPAATEPVAAERTASAIVTGRPDDLTQIKGIGPVFARRLNDAGITTFAQLAQATPDQLHEIVQAAEWQAVEPAAWIADARALSAPGEVG